MSTNKENFKALVSSEKTDTVRKNKERIKNRARLRESQDIAMKVLDKLDELGWSQRKLAEQMGILPQQVTKIVRGKENLTLDTIVKLQEVLKVPLLASFYENSVESFIEVNASEIVYQAVQPLDNDSFATVNYLTPNNSMSVSYNKFNETSVA